MVRPGTAMACLDAPSGHRRACIRFQVSAPSSALQMYLQTGRRGTHLPTPVVDEEHPQPGLGQKRVAARDPLTNQEGPVLGEGLAA